MGKNSWNTQERALSFSLTDVHTVVTPAGTKMSMAMHILQSQRTDAISAAGSLSGNFFFSFSGLGGVDLAMTNEEGVATMTSGQGRCPTTTTMRPHTHGRGKGRGEPSSTPRERRPWHTSHARPARRRVAAGSPCTLHRESTGTIDPTRWTHSEPSLDGLLSASRHTKPCFFCLAAHNTATPGAPYGIAHTRARSCKKTPTTHTPLRNAASLTLRELVVPLKLATLNKAITQKNTTPHSYILKANASSKPATSCSHDVQRRPANSAGEVDFSLLADHSRSLIQGSTLASRWTGRAGPGAALTRTREQVGGLFSLDSSPRRTRILTAT